MPHLDAAALDDDPAGLAFLRDVLGPARPERSARLECPERPVKPLALRRAPAPLVIRKAPALAVGDL